MEYFITAGKATVHIEDFGKQKEYNHTIVFLHGYLETMYIWSQFVDLLKDKYRIITLDLPGHGISSTAPDNAPNTMEYCAETVRGVFDKCNIEKAVLAGHSMGGFIAMNFAELYPEKVEKIILFNSHPYPDDPLKSNDRDREVALILNGKLETLASLSFPKMYFQDNLRRLDDKICETIELCEMHDPAGIIASIRGMQKRKDMTDWLIKNSNTLPILSFCGDNDFFMTVENQEKMRNQIPSVKYIILQNTGHNSFIEEPEKCAAIVEEFIGY